MKDMFFSWRDEVQKHAGEVKKYFQSANSDKQPKLWVTMLYGSQNYGLASLDSDVDTKTMLLPSFDDVCMGRPMVSTEIVMPDGSLDNCKDFRAMFENYKKGNINFMETLYTDTPLFHVESYKDSFMDLREHRDLIANSQPRRLMHMTAGMAQQKDVAFDKPFAGKKDVLEKYGYDPKQLHHMVRLRRFMEVFMETGDFSKALYSSHFDVDFDFHRYVMGLKLSPLPLKEAEELRVQTREEVAQLLQKSNAQLPELKDRDLAVEYLDTLTEELMKKHLKDYLLSH